MRKIEIQAKAGLILLLLSIMNLVGYAQGLRVASFNLRYANTTDTGNLWKDRALPVSELIRFHDFDVFGTQEALKNQLDDISAYLPTYDRYGLGRDDGKSAGEHSAIFFKKERFSLLDKGDFWLSETPEKPGLGWDATCCNRICSWVKLEDKLTKKQFYFFNVHYDHQGVIARQESSKLILQKVKEIAKGNPTLLTGDFNGSEETAWYQAIAQSGLLFDTQKLAKHPYKPNASFNGFGNARSLASDDIIDHVFVTKDFQVTKWGVLTDTYHGKFPSDHFPVMADLIY
ncbi:endonuclease/exonuclease/phosphatase family protein [Olivibacter sitiensis]|uniref:endonuclease/exonuclease/phosphatase family protein n=1 Tax=Olivibacter sitiensis TaxID=376470 RepID=UPI00041D7E40|nr:endonuclease/exonuclease/phosphatase family protein [Olivibacter sitiensis]